jgi:hypothetical protein
VDAKANGEDDHRRPDEKFRKVTIVQEKEDERVDQHNTEHHEAEF